MAKKFPNEFKFEVTEVIGVISESDKNDWCKAVAKISVNDGVPKVHVRNLNIPQDKMGKGVSLDTDEEVDSLVDILVSQEYGSIDVLEEAVKKRKGRLEFVRGASNAFVTKEEQPFTLRIN